MDYTERSKLINTNQIVHTEKHKDSGEYIKSIIYGGLDGVVSVFVAVAAAKGTNAPIAIVLVLGLAKLVAGAISMGVGDLLSTDAEVDMAKAERRREEWEVDNYLQGEIDEMVEFYEGKGVDYDSAVQIVGILSKYRTAFVDIMMAEELGIDPKTTSQVPWKHGLVNFTSFIGFGVVPLIVYVLATFVHVHITHMYTFYASIAASGLTLVVMGILKGYLTGSNPLVSAFFTLVLGGMAAGVGYGIGYALDYYFPEANIHI